MAIQLIDTATPQVGLKGGAEKLNANFTATENAASRLVQSSPTDATAGRVMAVGAFGVGGIDGNFSGDQAVSTDLGFTAYYAVNSTNGVAAADRSAVFSIDNGVAGGGKIAIDRDLKSAYFQIQNNASSFDPWIELYHSANLVKAQNVSGGTVLASSQTAGSNLVPAQSGNWSPAADTANNAYNLWVKQ